MDLPTLTLTLTLRITTNKVNGGSVLTPLLKQNVIHELIQSYRLNLVSYVVVSVHNYPGIMAPLLSIHASG